MASTLAFELGGAEPAVVVDHVSKTFHVSGRDIVALRDVSLQVTEGEFVSLVGPSGCGKSTLLRLIAGLDHPDAGTCAANGDLVHKPSLTRGVVFQDHRLLPWLSVRDNVRLALQMLPLTAEAKARRVAELLDLVGLSGFADAKPHQLSGGMSQRAAIARALAPRPKILLLDEPLGALDSLTRGKLQNELLRIWEHEGVTVILVTHDAEEAIYLSNRIVVMEPRPGRVRRVIPVDLAYPRDRTSVDFVQLRREVLQVLENEEPADEISPR